MAEEKSEIDLSDILYTFTQKSVADFPELSGKFAIYVAATNALYGSLTSKEEQQQLREYLSTQAQTAQTSRSREMDGYSLMIFKDNGRRSHTFSTTPYAQEVTSILEHELGHLVAPGGLNSPLAECIAEIFSIIRQQQQNPTNRETLEQVAVSRASSARQLVTGDASHFYLPVLQEMERFAISYDLTQMPMPPVYAANFAYRLSYWNAVPDDALQQLKKEYASAKTPLQELDVMDFAIDNKPVMQKIAQECAKIMFDAAGENADLVFNTGKAFLEPFLDKRNDILLTWDDADLAAFDNAFWNDVREKIKERPVQAESTPERTLRQQARDIMIFGLFDKDPDEKIDPAAYESKENLAYLRRAMDAYVSISMAAGPDTDQEEVIARSCQIAEQSLATGPRRTTPPAQRM